VRNLAVAHAIKRCMITRFGKAHCGDMTPIEIVLTNNTSIKVVVSKWAPKPF
jgi:hypothetical protein